jgi:hypothetical protein
LQSRSLGFAEAGTFRAHPSTGAHDRNATAATITGRSGIAR